TRVDVRASEPTWTQAFEDVPGAVVLSDGLAGTVWLPEPPDAARRRLAGLPNLDAAVRGVPCEDVVVVADDLAVLDRGVADLRAALAGPDTWTWTSWAPARPELRVDLDRARLAAAGLSEARVADAVAGVAGRPAGTLRDGR